MSKGYMNLTAVFGPVNMCVTQELLQIREYQIVTAPVQYSGWIFRLNKDVTVGTSYRKGYSSCFLSKLLEMLFKDHVVVLTQIFLSNSTS